MYKVIYNSKSVDILEPYQGIWKGLPDKQIATFSSWEDFVKSNLSDSISDGIVDMIWWFFMDLRYNVEESL